MFDTYSRFLSEYSELPPISRDEDMRKVEIAQITAARDTCIRAGSPRPNPKFHVGGQVLLGRSQNRSRRDRRLALRWDGLFTIADARPQVYSLRERVKQSRAYTHERRPRPYMSATGTVGSEGESNERRLICHAALTCYI